MKASKDKFPEERRGLERTRRRMGKEAYEAMS